jgi:hypothetical protein
MKEGTAAAKAGNASAATAAIGKNDRVLWRNIKGRP